LVQKKTRSFIISNPFLLTNPRFFFAGRAAFKKRQDPVEPHLAHRSSMVEWMIRMHNKDRHPETGHAAGSKHWKSMGDRMGNHGNLLTGA